MGDVGLEYTEQCSAVAAGFYYLTNKRVRPSYEKVTIGGAANGIIKAYEHIQPVERPYADLLEEAMRAHSLQFPCALVPAAACLAFGFLDVWNGYRVLDGEFKLIRGKWIVNIGVTQDDVERAGHRVATIWNVAEASLSNIVSSGGSRAVRCEIDDNEELEPEDNAPLGYWTKTAPQSDLDAQAAGYPHGYTSINHKYYVDMARSYARSQAYHELYNHHANYYDWTDSRRSSNRNRGYYYMDTDGNWRISDAHTNNRRMRHHVADTRGHGDSQRMPGQYQGSLGKARSLIEKYIA